MRYRKGMVDISEERDIPALKLVRDARAISLSQATSELILANVEVHPNSTRWRFNRLSKVGLIERLSHEQAIGEPVYVITQIGLAFLESKGHAILALGSATKTVLQPAEVFHMLELNAIRIALKQASLLEHWKNELQIVSENLVNFGSTIKDYDAIVTLNLDGRKVRFALEYERTAKSTARYKDIVRAIEGDSAIDFVLYLVANQELLFLLNQELRRIGSKIAIGLASLFRAQLLETRVLFMAGQGTDYRPLVEVLTELPEVIEEESALFAS